MKKLLKLLLSKQYRLKPIWNEDTLFIAVQQRYWFSFWTNVELFQHYNFAVLFMLDLATQD